MRLIPRYIRRLRPFLVLVLAVSAISAVIVGFTQSSSDHDQQLQLISGSGQITAARSRVDDVMFTSEELRYVRYGDGEVGVAEDDPRYLAFIRSHMSRPANSLPLRLADKSGRKHFSQV